MYLHTIFTEEELKEKYDKLVEQLSKLQAENLHIQKALDFLEKMPPSSMPGDISGQARANAASEIIKVRENTNKLLLEHYASMYEDLRGAIFQCAMEDLKPKGEDDDIAEENDED